MSCSLLEGDFAATSRKRILVDLHEGRVLKACLFWTSAYPPPPARISSEVNSAPCVTPLPFRISLGILPCFSFFSRRIPRSTRHAALRFSATNQTTSSIRNALRAPELLRRPVGLVRGHHQVNASRQPPAASCRRRRRCGHAAYADMVIPFQRNSHSDTRA